MYVKVGLLGIRYWKEAIGIVCVLFLLMFMFFFSATEEEQQFIGNTIDGKAKVSAQVMRYEPLIEKYAIKYNVEEHINVLLAKMMQESGGRGGDPMQSSESLGLPPNTLNDPELSIDVGIKYFAQVLKQAGGDVPLALQSYNFGGGFIDYAKDRGGYSKKVAKAFSAMMAMRLGWDSYGDVNYVDNVMRYIEDAEVVSGEPSGTPNSGGWIHPIPTGTITSYYGNRPDPFTGLPEYHGGTDFGCTPADSIRAAAGGKVTRAGWQDPARPNAGYGKRVYIDHGNGLTTVYGHLSLISVKAGQNVQPGQKIGNCGTTGSSTGNHLHLELHQNGKRVDPKMMKIY